MVGLVGSALGKELNKIVHADSNPRSSRFCCPLDEALVECILTKHSNGAAEGKLTAFTLPPYGKYPASTGRTKIGHLLTSTVETFFQSLAKQSGLDISLIKIRGDNGHHVVESAFKAFSRALRNLIDGTDTNNYSSVEFKKMWGESSDSYRDGLELGREGKVERCTKETSILVRAYLDGLKNGHGVDVNTGIQTMDDFVSILAKEACISMEVKCKGDLYVDDHHTSEDVSIAIGQVMNSALGTKAGLNRMWCAVGTYGGEFISIRYNPYCDAT
jgi:imidazoleglycerol-phosphate dehydratase